MINLLCFLYLVYFYLRKLRLTFKQFKNQIVSVLVLNSVIENLYTSNLTTIIALENQ